GENITETQYDYRFGWTSTSTNITDKRLTSSWQFVSQAQDVTALRPRYITYQTEVPVVTTRQVTRWKTELTYEDRKVFTTQRVYENDTDTTPDGVFSAESITALNGITIVAGRDVSLSGKVTASALDSTIDITAGRHATVEGTLPDNAVAGSLAAV